MNGLTPTGCRTINQVGRFLTDSYRYITDSDNPEVMDEWEEEKRSILERESINWWTEGTRRIIAGFGRTAEGEVLTTDNSPVVAKYEPWVIEMETVREQSSNYHEGRTYRTAIERTDDDLFARVIHTSEDWTWIAMEECIPVFPSPPSQTDYGQEYLVNRNRMRAFEERFTERGWYEHDFNNGNIGVTVEGETVLLDYGSFTRVHDE